MLVQPNNLIEIDSLIESFIKENQSGIATCHRVYFKNDNALSLRSLTVELKNELRTGCVAFFNKDRPIEELNSYLFYIVNAFCKKHSNNSVKKTTNYLCPGCLFLGKETIIEYINHIFKCNICEDDCKKIVDYKKIHFYQTFIIHNKQGYRCSDCNRFIPHPMDKSTTIVCPYFDCCFVGSWSELNRMHHPSNQTKKEILNLDSKYTAVADQNIDVLKKMELEEDVKKKINFLHETIESQRNNISYSSSEFTAKHKIIIYNVFEDFIKKYPIEMIDYLINHNSSGYSGFQHKIFQEYIRLLENTLPFTFKKNKIIYKVESLLDNNLKLFDGISIFNSIVSDNGNIKNNTTEFYIGGRAGAITKPFYIGKLLNIINKNTKEVLMDKVVEYTFSLIKTHNIVPGTEVIVTHLRVPPHYQMGGMSYINRIRKKIVEKSRIFNT